MPSRIQGWWNGIGIQVQTVLLDHLVQVRSNANRIKSHYNLEVLEVIALPYVHQTTWSASVLLPTGSKVFINTCTFYINIPPLSPPHQVFGPSIGPVGDCIALRPLDHFVPVRSTANRIKSFRQDLCLRTASHPMKKL